MQDQKYIIYKHTNKINNKVYIGQTNNYKKRCTPGNYASSPYFYHAIQKYGWDNFQHQILKQNLTAEQANKQEIFYIQYYHATDNNYGYNIANGGALKRNYSGKNNPFYGKHHTEQTKRKLSEQHKHIRTKAIECINTGEIFESAAIAGKWCKITKQNIQRCCKGGRPSAGKHPQTGEPLHWRYIGE